MLPFASLMARTADAVLNPLERIAAWRWERGLSRGRELPSKAEFLSAAADAAPPSGAVRRLQSHRGHAVPEAWLAELALHTEVVLKPSPLTWDHGRLLYLWLSELLSRIDLSSVSIVEVGTARGFSALCMAKAMQARNVEGRVLTLDVLPHRVPMLWNCIDDERGPSTRDNLLSPWETLVERYLMFFQGDSLRVLARLHLPRVHFAFIDGQHDEAHVREEFKWVAERQRRGDAVVFDDYNVESFPGVVRAVDAGLLRFGYDSEIVDIGLSRCLVHAVRR